MPRPDGSGMTPPVRPGAARAIPRHPRTPRAVPVVRGGRPFPRWRTDVRNG